MLSIVIAITFFKFTFSDTNQPSFCRDGQALKGENSIPVKADINYFMRSSPQTKELGFATNLNRKAPVNRVLNARTGQIREVPGFIDPVPSPDGSIIATPIEKSFDPVTGTFTSELIRPYYYLEVGKVKYCKEKEKKCEDSKVTESELRQGKTPFRMLAMAILDRDGKELLVDSQVNSFYQTFGQFNSDSNQVNYRLLYETATGLAIRDYKRSATDGTFAPPTKPKSLCGGKMLALPSISKDGLQLSAFDPVANETHIYEIGESGTKCEIKEKFPGMLGKVDFSPNRKKLAFHIDHASATKNSIFEMPGEAQDLAAIIYDRDKKSFRLLMDVEGQQSYFPVFLSDDEIALVTATKNAKGESKSFAISIGHLQESSSENYCDTCMKADELDGQKAAIVGAMINDKCRKKADYNFKSSAMSFASLSPDSCRSVLRSCNANCRQSLKQKILKQISTDSSNEEGQYAKSPVLWNAVQIKELQNVDDICEKIEPAGSAGVSNPIDSSGTR